MLNDYLSDLHFWETLGLIMFGSILLWSIFSGISALIQHCAGRQKGLLKSRENKLQRLFQRNPKKYISREAVQKQIIGLFAVPRQLILIKENIL